MGLFQRHKDREDDGKINTPKEMVDFEERALWEHRPMEALKYERIERRKLLNWFARFSISIANAITFIFLVYLLFFADLKDGHRDLVNIMVGAYVGVLAKSTDYWFKDKEDSEDKELADHNENAKEAIKNGKEKEED